MALKWKMQIIMVGHLSVKQQIKAMWKLSESCRNMVLVYSAENNVWTALKSALLTRLTPNDPYMGRTAPLTSKRYILYIYSTNIGTDYFKPALHSPFFLFKMQFVS
jgi:hypothetical protein